MPVEEKINRSIEEVFDLQRKSSLRLRTEPVGRRKQRLKALNTWIHANRHRLREAVYSDLHKPSLEFDAVEVLHVLNEIRVAVRHLPGWISPKPVDAPPDMIGTRSEIRYEPRGVCLIIAPWNYPFSLCAGPLVSALAAGNTAILKPSELTPNMSGELVRMVTELFDPSEVAVFEGDAEVSKALLRLPVDHIFFTGSPAVGREVMKAAAANLVSVTLELGGKCPAIVTATARIEEAARRIAVGKFVNAGQSCVAPDYVLVDASVRQRFEEALVRQIQRLFTENGEPFMQSAHYARVISPAHFDRLHSLLAGAVERGARVLLGGEHSREARFFYPTVLTNVPLDAPVMAEEIFGPVLPVIPYVSADDAVTIVNARPKPLGVYVFAGSEKDSAKILSETSSGGACINDCAIQFLHHRLPFGGVNYSGIGKAHGYAGFLAFSNEKPILKQRSGLTTVGIFYPPYTGKIEKVMNWVMKVFYR